MANCTCIRVSNEDDARELTDRLAGEYDELEIDLGYAGIYYSPQHPWLKLTPYGYHLLGEDDSEAIHDLVARLKRETVMLCPYDPSITFTHFVDGARVRHLAACAERGWLEIEGEPEAWEAAAFSGQHHNFPWECKAGTPSPFWASHARAIARVFDLPGFIERAPEGYWAIEMKEI